MVAGGKTSFSILTGTAITGPLISVIVPCYNQSESILQTLESVRAQTYPRWECIIVDDGSTDDSLAKIYGFIAGDERFRPVPVANAGVSAARNLAAKQARGTLLFPLDGDDYIHPDCLQRCLQPFLDLPAVRLVCPQGVLFGAEQGPWTLPPFHYKTMLKYNMIHNSSLFLKSDFDRVGGYRLNMAQGFEDWDFFIALLHGMPAEAVRQLPEALFFYRVKPGSRRVTLDGSVQRQKMSDLIVYNNFEIYREYFPDILARITEYDFNKTMLAKRPVRMMTRLLIGLSRWKQKVLAQKPRNA